MNAGDVRDALKNLREAEMFADYVEDRPLFHNDHEEWFQAILDQIIPLTDDHSIVMLGNAGVGKSP